MRAGKILILVFAMVAAVMCQFTATDMHKLARLGEVAIHPQTGNPIYSVSHWDPVYDVTVSNLKSPQGDITLIGNQKDYSPVFYPADPTKLFFMSTRVSPPQIYYTTVGLLTASKLSDFPIEVSNLFMTPNYIVFSAEVYESCGADLACTAKLDAQAAANPNTGIVFDALFVRHWDVIVTPGKTSQLFTQRIQKIGDAYVLMGSPSLVGRGLPSCNMPVPPDGGKEQISISPKYDTIAYTIALVNHESAWNTGWLVYQTPVDPNTGVPTAVATCITCNQAGPRTTNPAFDPSGRYISYLSMDRAGFEADRFHIVIYDRETKTHEPLTHHWDRSIAEMAWTPNGTHLLVALDDDGHHRIYAVQVPSGIHAMVIRDGTNGGIKIASNGVVVYSHQSYNESADLKTFVWNQHSGAGPITPVTNLNPSLVSVGLDAGVSFTFPSEDGSSVQGWFIKPRNFNPANRYPFVLLVHGGPQGAWNSAWSYRWNPQLWAQQGYAVALINPHGSTGFGQHFTDAVSGNWGGIPYRDLMTGVQVVLDAHPWIDRSRLAACGASYGGYMVNWIHGQTSIFSSLVTHDGIYDVPSTYGSTDELWFPEWEFKGTPWEVPTAYEQWNPSSHVAKWSTPTLVIHGAKDYRLSVSQGLMAFSTLQRRGIPSRLLLYPLENHWVSKPSNSVVWYKEVIAWIDKYTKNRK